MPFTSWACSLPCLMSMCVAPSVGDAATSEKAPPPLFWSPNPIGTLGWYYVGRRQITRAELQSGHSRVNAWLFFSLKRAIASLIIRLRPLFYDSSGKKTTQHLKIIAWACCLGDYCSFVTQRSECHLMKWHWCCNTQTLLFLCLVQAMTKPVSCEDTRSTQAMLQMGVSDE